MLQAKRTVRDFVEPGEGGARIQGRESGGRERKTQTVAFKKVAYERRKMLWKEKKEKMSAAVEDEDKNVRLALQL